MTTHQHGGAAVFLPPPSTCGSELDREEWSDHIALRLDDDRLLGLRTNSVAIAELIRSQLADRVVSEQPVTSFYYSVKVGIPGRRSANPLHFIHAGGGVVAGTRDMSALITALGRHLAGHLTPPQDGTHVRALAIQMPDGIALAPEFLTKATAGVDRHLIAKGWGVASTPHVLLRTFGGMVTLPKPVLRVPDPDPAALGPHLDEPALRGDTQQLARWFIRGTAQDEHMTPARFVFLAMSQVVGPLEGEEGNALRDLAAVAMSTPIDWLAMDMPEATVENLAQVLAARTR